MEVEKLANDFMDNVHKELVSEVSRRSKASPWGKLEADVKRQEAELQKVQVERKIEQAKLRADAKAALSKLEEQHKIEQEAAARKLVERMNDRETCFVNLVFKKIEDDYRKLREQHRIDQDKLQAAVERQLRKLEEQHKMEHESQERVHEIQRSFNNLAMEKMDAQEAIREDVRVQAVALRQLEEKLQIEQRKLEADLIEQRSDHRALQLSSELARLRPWILSSAASCLAESRRSLVSFCLAISWWSSIFSEKLEAAVHKLQTPLPKKPNEMPTKISLEARRRIGLKIASQFLRRLKR